MPANVLIVEDEDSIQELLSYNFKAEGFNVRCLDGTEDVVREVVTEIPDLIVLDWMLPNMSGIEICRLLRARAETRDVPIIMLTARGEEVERVRGLATGADDFVVKPFSVPELLARVKSLLRRSSPEAVSDLLRAGDLSLDRRTRRVQRNSRDIDLSPTEFRLLEHMMQAPGRVFTRAQLLDAVWGRDVYVDERTVDVHVGRLRKSINRARETNPIRTVRGVGYSFDERFGAINA
jgi:two-component system, OmpR family, phosphate regulon response regulator PhoB